MQLVKTDGYNSEETTAILWSGYCLHQVTQYPPKAYALVNKIVLFCKISFEM